MKKTIPATLALLAIFVGVFVFLKKAVVHRPRAAELVPAEALFFAQFPDLARTKLRWPQTALAQIWHEPEMQAFLEKARANAPQFQLWRKKSEQIARVFPREAFLAVTSIDGSQPRFVAGFAFSGGKADVEVLLAEPRAELKRSQPAGKSDITAYGGAEIETFAFGDTLVAETISDGWYFVGNNLELLKTTLDASAGKTAPANALSASEAYKKATTRLPSDADALFFGQVNVLTDRIASLLVASGQAPDAKQLEELKRVKSLAWSVKLDGEQVRDTIFAWSPNTAAEPPLAQNALALSAAQTVFYYASVLPKSFEVPAQSSLALAMFVPGYAGLERALTEKGLKWSDLSQAFGPAFGSVGDWPENAAQPSLIFAVDIRDAAKAKAFVDVFTSGVGGPAWGREEKPGLTFYQSPAAPGFSLASPAVALTDRLLLFGFDVETVKAGVERLASGQSPLGVAPAFQSATRLVEKPTSAFGYLDLKTTFERLYGTFRPFLAMSLAFSPDAGKYIDGSKLPSTETISRHLSPSVYSQSVTEDGTLIESSGTLTFNQVLGAGIGGAAAAAYPMLEKALSGGLKLDTGLLMPPASGLPAPAPQPTPPIAPSPGQP